MLVNVSASPIGSIKGIQPGEAVANSRAEFIRRRERGRVSDRGKESQNVSALNEGILDGDNS